MKNLEYSMGAYKHETAAPKIEILSGSEKKTIKCDCWLLVDFECLFFNKL